MSLFLGLELPPGYMASLVAEKQDLLGHLSRISSQYLNGGMPTMTKRQFLLTMLN